MVLSSFSIAAYVAKVQRERRTKALALIAQGATMRQLVASLGLPQACVRALLSKLLAEESARAEGKKMPPKADRKKSAKKADRKTRVTKLDCLPVAAICAAINQGAAIQTVCRRFKISPYLWKRILIESQETLDEINGRVFAAIEAGAHLRQLCREFRMSIFLIERVMATRGKTLAYLDPRKCEQRQRKFQRQQRRVALIEELQKLRQQGLTLAEIGARLGLTRQRIHQILLPRKSRKESPR